jgi:hypothetical protein
VHGLFMHNSKKQLLEFLLAQGLLYLDSWFKVRAGWTRSLEVFSTICTVMLDYCAGTREMRCKEIWQAHTRMAHMVDQSLINIR